jgi:two-component sensor histidine kinase
MRLLDSDSCDLFLRDSLDGLTLRGSTEAPEMIGCFRLGKGRGISARVLETKEPIFIKKGVEEDPDYARFPPTPPGRFESLAALPLTFDGAPPHGVLTIKRTVPWAFGTTERRQLVHLSKLVAESLNAFIGAYGAGAQTNRLGALSEVSKTIASSPYLEEILQLLVHLTAQQFSYRVCTVRLLDERREELVLRATQAPAKAYQRKRAIKLGESIAGRAIAENRPIIVPDVQVEDDYIGHDLAEQQGLRSMICVPLTIQDRAVGVLSCYTDEVREFSEDEVAALETLAKQAAYAIEHAKLQVRDTLMQEMHHRVKNNLQQVASLMRLQLRHSQYKSLEEALNDTLARILAIAAVHDLLSREDLDHVSVRNVAEALVQHQTGSLILPGKSIRFDVRGDDVTLNTTQATQVALVLNELILNAVEHGFKVTDIGEVHVTVEDREGEISLWVSNNGDQLPADFDPTKKANLGLQIVENLARALNGRFKLSSILGWTVGEVKFVRAMGE